MKRSKAPLLLGLGCVLAVGMMLYPMASNWLSGQTRSQVITEYETAVEVLDNQATQQALELARAYNRDLLEQSCSIAGFSVSGAPTPDKDILTALDPIGGGMLATLEIPAIDVILPVYYGTQSTTLTAGVGVVEGSSLPVGGTGSHAVLATAALPHPGSSPTWISSHKVMCSSCGCWIKLWPMRWTRSPWFSPTM